MGKAFYLKLNGAMLLVLAVVLASIFVVSSGVYAQGFMDDLKGKLAAPSLNELIDGVVKPKLEKTFYDLNNGANDKADAAEGSDAVVDVGSVKVDDLGAGGDVDEAQALKDRANQAFAKSDDMVRKQSLFDAYESLFFTKEQRETIFDARNFRGPVYEAYLAELEALRLKELEGGDENAEDGLVEEIEITPAVKPPEEERYLALQGILYKGAGEWVVWLNGLELKPDALPVEALRFEVYPDYVDIAWFDEYLNKVIPVRLKPQQRFHMDSLIYLPIN